MEFLIVDDSRAMRMILGRVLRKAGYEESVFREAADGAEGLAAVKAASPDLVLSDWNMPEMSGIELLRALRAEGIDVPFGFVTSESTAEMRDAAMAAGASFLIAKPFTADAFQEALATMAA
jgi:two-component system, chemotaxis family, chemotaxis protein CheY